MKRTEGGSDLSHMHAKGRTNISKAGREGAPQPKPIGLFVISVRAPTHKETRAALPPGGPFFIINTNNLICGMQVIRGEEEEEN